MQNGFDRVGCRRNVKDIAHHALNLCTEKLTKKFADSEAGNGLMRGTEEEFDRSFAETARKNGVWHKSGQSAKELGVSDRVMQERGTTGGRIDCTLRFGGYLIGIEHKVVRLPRLRNTHVNGALYDVGQITIDNLRLEKARKLSGGYCAIIVYGPLVRDANSEDGIVRHFRNSMFLDYSISKAWGEIKSDGSSRRSQIGSLRRMGFDSPYKARGLRAMDFCARNSERTLAVVGLWAERQGRLPTSSDLSEN